MFRSSLALSVLLSLTACSDSFLSGTSANGRGSAQLNEVQDDPADTTPPVSDPDPGDPTDDPNDPTDDPTVPVTPPPAVGQVIQDCDTAAGYQVDSFDQPGVPGQPTVWLTSVYETHSNHSGGNHPMGSATVSVTAPGSHILVFASYEPVTWNIEIGPDSDVQEILVIGYHEQIVQGADNVPVTTLDYVSGTNDTGSFCGYSWPDDGQGCETEQLVETVENLLGLPVNHFEGCYTATTFEIAGAPVLPPPPPVTAEVIQDCAVDQGYQVDSFDQAPSVPGQPFVWLTSIYETHGNHSGGNHPMGTASVTVDQPGPHILVFSSYEPVTWQLDIEPFVEVEEILIFGYHAQIVEGADGIPVTVFDYDSGSSNGPFCGYSWPYNGQGCDTDALVAGVEAELGYSINHFEGCYQASEFVIGGTAQPPQPPTPLTDPNGVPVEDVPCGPGETIEIAYPISALNMSLGASDNTGDGWCSGFVSFSDDLDISTAGTLDADGNLIQVPMNGFAESCNAVHCNTVIYGDLTEEPQLCSLYAVCENGLARSTGWTW